MPSVSASDFFQIVAAWFRLKGLSGTRDNRSASFSEKSILSILYQDSEGGAPWGNLFILLENLSMLYMSLSIHYLDLKERIGDCDLSIKTWMLHQEMVHDNY